MDNMENILMGANKDLKEQSPAESGEHAAAKEEVWKLCVNAIAEALGTDTEKARKNLVEEVADGLLQPETGNALQGALGEHAVEALQKLQTADGATAVQVLAYLQKMQSGETEAAQVLATELFANANDSAR